MQQPSKTRIALLSGLVSLSGGSLVSATLAVEPTCFGKQATVIGTDGRDQLTGTSGDDVIVGLGNDDRIDAGAGNDRVCAGAGEDTVVGGPGDDRVDGGDEQRNAGFDFLDLSGAPGAVSVDLTQGTAEGEGIDRLVSVENIRGSRFDDVMVGDQENNFLRGDKGADKLEGSAGADHLEGGAARSQWMCTPGSGDDELIGGVGRDLLEGCDGSDRLSGGPGHDGLVGGSRDERNCCFEAFYCGTTADGNDVLEASAGDDQLWGCGGDDVIDGGDGSDLAAFWDSEAAVTVDLSAGTATGEGSDVVVGIENVSGTHFDDILTGDEQSNELDGGVIVRGGASDTIVGRFGDDSISGGGGDDVIFGGVGNDRLDGGPGRDLARFFCGYSSGGPGFNDDVTIDLAQGIARGDGDDLVIAVEDAHVDSIYCRTARLIGSDGPNRLMGGYTSVITIRSGGGDDVLLGHSGEDSLYGEAGDDTLLGETGADRLDGGEGNDLCDAGDLDLIISCEQPPPPAYEMSQPDLRSQGMP